MRRLAVSAARERIADVLAHVRLRRERIVVTRHGRPIGAIVPLHDLERLVALDRQPPEESAAVTAHRVSWGIVTQHIHRPRTRHGTEPRGR